MYNWNFVYPYAFLVSWSVFWIYQFFKFNFEVEKRVFFGNGSVLSLVILLIIEVMLYKIHNWLIGCSIAFYEAQTRAQHRHQ